MADPGRAAAAAYMRSRPPPLSTPAAGEGADGRGHEQQGGQPEAGRSEAPSNSGRGVSETVPLSPIGRPEAAAEEEPPAAQTPPQLSPRGETLQAATLEMAGAPPASQHSAEAKRRVHTRPRSASSSPRKAVTPKGVKKMQQKDEAARGRSESNGALTLPASSWTARRASAALRPSLEAFWKHQIHCERSKTPC